MALEYADIPYETVYDRDVLSGGLERYDWLHLHHEDFTGQYGKFYAGYRNADWYIQQQILFEEIAKGLGFDKVSEEKKSVARMIRGYVRQGGFLFAMCSACDSYDIAMAADQLDIVPREYDHDGVTPGCRDKLDFSRTFAFEGFDLVMDPYAYEFSNIDMTPAAARQTTTLPFSSFPRNTTRYPLCSSRTTSRSSRVLWDRRPHSGKVSSRRRP